MKKILLILYTFISNINCDREKYPGEFSNNNPSYIPTYPSPPVYTPAPVYTPTPSYKPKHNPNLVLYLDKYVNFHPNQYLYNEIHNGVINNISNVYIIINDNSLKEYYKNMDDNTDFLSLIGTLCKKITFNIIITTYNIYAPIGILCIFLLNIIAAFNILEKNIHIKLTLDISRLPYDEKQRILLEINAHPTLKNRIYIVQ